MLEYIFIAVTASIAVPFVIMIWVAAAMVCHLAWRDFFNDR